MDQEFGPTKLNNASTTAEISRYFVPFPCGACRFTRFKREPHLISVWRFKVSGMKDHSDGHFEITDHCVEAVDLHIH